MRMVSKTCLLAVSTLAMMVAPVHAASISSPANGTTVTATGTVDISIVGWAGRRTCDVTLSGTIDSSGLVDKFAFTSGSSTNCNAEDQGVVEFPVSVTATSPTAVTIDAITLNSGGRVLALHLYERRVGLEQCNFYGEPSVRYH